MSNKKLNELANLINAKIKNYKNSITYNETGIVMSIGDGVAIVYGLENAMLNELIVFENGSKGIILNLDVETVGVVLLGKYDDIKDGSLVKRTKQIMSVPTGDQLLNRVIDSLGQPIDGKTKINMTNLVPIEKIAPGVISRQSIDTPIETGILSIDSMFPIGRGQRELIIGDRQTGKTTIAIDTIINQKNKNVKCIYVAIGQKRSSIVRIHETLQKIGAMKYTTIISSTASDLPALIYIAPYTGMTIAEQWLKKGEDVLIVFDDLSKHAISYRAISLLLHRPPGREAYPGDVFYLHSRLLERAGKLNKKNGGGSITALPIIETQAGDISAYIPTNVISITDGQLFLTTNLFNSGNRPAIDVGLSVSRVGSAAQKWYIKYLSSSLKLELAQYKELQSFAQFSSDLDKETKQIIEYGKRIMLMIKQLENSPLNDLQEIVFLYAIKYHYIKWIPLNQFDNFKQMLLLSFTNSKILKRIMTQKNHDVKTILQFDNEN